ncbi:hypothetical protein GS421_13520 [Rhodococcus hoagii]|nr:hypothetical protein [Prescottella equi]
MPTIDVHVHSDGIRLPRRRQVALSALAGAAASAVILASAQLAVGWQNSADSALLLNLGYAPSSPPSSRYCPFRSRAPETA